MIDQIDRTTRAKNTRDAVALNAKMTATGYGVEYKPLKHVRGWPTASTKPFSLFMVGGGHCASFATIDQAEANWRARAAC